MGQFSYKSFTDFLHLWTEQSDMWKKIPFLFLMNVNISCYITKCYKKFLKLLLFLNSSIICVAVCRPVCIGGGLPPPSPYMLFLPLYLGQRWFIYFVNWVLFMFLSVWRFFLFDLENWCKIHLKKKKKTFLPDLREMFKGTVLFFLQYEYIIFRNLNNIFFILVSGKALFGVYYSSHYCSCSNSALRLQMGPWSKCDFLILFYFIFLNPISHL